MNIDSTLENDYDCFLAFCREHHAAEGLQFWADVEDFKQRFREQSPPPPTPLPAASRQEDCTTPPLARRATASRLSSIFSRPKTTTRMSNASWANLKKALNVDAYATTSPSSPTNKRRPSSLHRTSSLFSSARSMTTMSATQQEDIDEKDEEVNEDVPSPPKTLVQHGSSLLKIELSMARNLSLKLGIKGEELRLVELAQAIFFKYLDINSPHWICVQIEQVEAIEDQLQEGDMTEDLFDAVQQIVYHDLRTSLFPMYMQKAFVSLSQVPPPPPALETTEQEPPASPIKSFTTAMQAPAALERRLSTLRRRFSTSAQ